MTPTVKRRDPSDVVWERIDKELGENISHGRMVRVGDYHWCGTATEPEQVTESTLKHRCMIWVKSEDQAWQPPAPLSTEGENPVDRLIQRLHLAGGGDVEGGNTPVLAMLYQAKALERIADMMKGVVLLLEKLNATHMGAYMNDRAPVYASAPVPLRCCGSMKPDQHFPDCPTLLTNIADWCVPCRHQEHSACKDGMTAGIHTAHCKCSVCHGSPIENSAAPYPHRFEGMEDNHFCTRCGGGRLHSIHQA